MTAAGAVALALSFAGSACILIQYIGRAASRFTRSLNSMPGGGSRSSLAEAEPAGLVAGAGLGVWAVVWATAGKPASRAADRQVTTTAESIFVIQPTGRGQRSSAARRVQEGRPGPPAHFKGRRGVARFCRATPPSVAGHPRRLVLAGATWGGGKFKSEKVMFEAPLLQGVRAVSMRTDPRLLRPDPGSRRGHCYTFSMFTSRKWMASSHDRGAWPWRRST